MTPLKVSITDIGIRRVVLSCSCVKVGRVVAVWEDVDDVIEQLRIDHRRQAPLCRHPMTPEGPGGDVASSTTSTTSDL